MAYSPWGCKESDTTEQLTLYLEGRFQLRFAFCIWIPVGPTPFVENTAICLLTAFTPWSESLGRVCVVYCWTPCFLPPIYVSMLPWSPRHTVLILQLCGRSLWLLQGYPFPELFGIDYFGPLPCCKIFKSSLSISTKNHTILIGIELNLYISFGKTNILTMLSLSVCEHSSSPVYLVHLWLLSSAFLLSTGTFYTYFVRFIPKYFIINTVFKKNLFVITL